MRPPYWEESTNTLLEASGFASHHDGPRVSLVALTSARHIGKSPQAPSTLQKSGFAFHEPGWRPGSILSNTLLHTPAIFGRADDCPPSRESGSDHTMIFSKLPN